MKYPFTAYEHNTKKHAKILVCYYLLETIVTQVVSKKLFNKIVKVYNKIGKLV